MENTITDAELSRLQASIAESQATIASWHPDRGEMTLRLSNGQYVTVFGSHFGAALTEAATAVAGQ